MSSTGTPEARTRSSGRASNSTCAPRLHRGIRTNRYGGLPVLPCAARRASSCRASYPIGLRSWRPWPISAVHNLPPHTVNDYGLGIATMSVRREATNVDLRGVPNQGATSEPRFSSRSVADRLLDLRPGQLKHHEGRPLVGKQPSDHRLTVRRMRAAREHPRPLPDAWQVLGKLGAIRRRDQNTRNPLRYWSERIFVCRADRI